MGEAHDHNRRRIEVLEAYEPNIADALARCDGDEARCLMPICALCARPFRIQLTEEKLALVAALPGPHRDVTIYLDSIEAGRLPYVDLKRHHEKLRVRLNRCGFRGSIIVGGTEAGWNARKRVWILHLHALAIGVPPEAWAELRRRLKRAPEPKPVHDAPLRDAARQLSYQQKFTTFHRPSRTGGGRAVPLPPPRLAELAAWLANYEFESFMFLFGARRRAGRIFIEARPDLARIDETGTNLRDAPNPPGGRPESRSGAARKGRSREKRSN